MSHAAGDSLGEVGIVENNVRRLAAKFLADALHGVRRTLGNVDAGAGRACERDHVDSGVLAHRDADVWAKTVDDVEDAFRHACFMEDFREDQRGRWRVFRRLQDHGATGCNRRRDLAGDLVERPVPRGDHADHADRLAHHNCRADGFLELILLENVQRRHQMTEAGTGLHLFGHRQRSAHFVGHGSADVLQPRLVNRNDLFQQRNTLFARGQRKRLECAARSGNSLVHVGFRSDGNLVHRLFRRRVNHRDGLFDSRIDPAAIDIELHTIGHDVSLTSRVRA